MMRFFEGLARVPAGPADGRLPAVAPGELAYDLDAAVADFVSSGEWDLDSLPIVAPPEDAGAGEGRVLADFTVPDWLATQARSLQTSGQLARLEEWVETLAPSEQPGGDQVGGLFTRVDQHPMGLTRRRREALGHRAGEALERHRLEARVYRAVIFSAQWRPGEPGSLGLYEKFRYDWLYEATEDGTAGEWLDLEVGGRSMESLPAAEREVLEYAGMMALLPFLCCFALLGCENASADPAPPEEDGGPTYLSPVVHPLYATSVARSGGGGWEIGAPSLRPGVGRFERFHDPDALPDGLRAGLYWIVDR